MLEGIGIALGALATVSTVAMWGFAALIYAIFMSPRTTLAFILLALMTVAASTAAAIWFGAFLSAFEMNTPLTILWYVGIVIVVSPFILSLVLNRSSDFGEASRG